MKLSWKIAVVAVVLVIAGAGGAYLYFKEYEPDRARYPVRGIDVSHHQGTIDWAAVADDDVAFAYVKVSEGGDHRDREFRRNLAEANLLGLPAGAYHFFTFCRPAADQARNFIEAVSEGVTQLPPVVDLEFVGNCSHRPSPEELASELAIFIDMVESELGRSLVYYAPDDFLDAYSAAMPKRSLWRRSILRQPDPSDWIIWQYHPAGRVAGIDGNVDLNVLSIELDDLISLSDNRR